MDCLPFPGVDVVANLAEPVFAEVPKGFAWMEEVFERKVLRYAKWRWSDSSIEEVHCSHFLEHLDRLQRVHFFNELHRVLKLGGKATVIIPHWASCRAYGDPTHQWPAVAEFLWYYLKHDWRLSQAPHTDTQNWPQGLKCNFEVTWGYGLEANVATRNAEYQQMAIQYYKEACTDMIATLTKC